MKITKIDKNLINLCEKVAERKLNDDEIIIIVKALKAIKLEKLILVLYSNYDVDMQISANMINGLIEENVLEFSNVTELISIHHEIMEKYHTIYEDEEKVQLRNRINELEQEVDILKEELSILEDMRKKYYKQMRVMDMLKKVYNLIDKDHLKTLMAIEKAQAEVNEVVKPMQFEGGATFEIHKPIE